MFRRFQGHGLQSSTKLSSIISIHIQKITTKKGSSHNICAFNLAHLLKLLTRLVFYNSCKKARIRILGLITVPLKDVKYSTLCYVL